MTSDLSFDYRNGKQHEETKNLVKGTSGQQNASIPACVTDSLSAIFYAASRPMVVGQQLKFPLADSMRTVTVSMKVEGKEEIKTPAGTFPDSARTAPGRRRHRKESRQHLDLVHGRCPPPASADAGAAILGHYHLSLTDL